MQRVGLALVYPAGQSLIADLFAPEKRGRAFGVLLTIGALGGIAGSFLAINLGGMHFGPLQVCVPACSLGPGSCAPAICARSCNFKQLLLPWQGSALLSAAGHT